MAQTVKRLSMMRETRVRSLGWEDPLEKEMAPGKSHGQRSLVGYSPWGRKQSDTTEGLHFTPNPIPKTLLAEILLMNLALTLLILVPHLYLVKNE